MGFLQKIFGKRDSGDKYEVFWGWFEKKSDWLFDIDTEQKKKIVGVDKQLKKIDPSMSFLFGPVDEVTKKREFIISPGGIKANINHTEELRKSQPSSDNWNIIYYRPRKQNISPSFGYEYDNFGVYARDVFYTRTVNNKKIDIIIYFRGYESSNINFFGGIGFQFLDDILGELIVMNHIGEIVFASLSDAPVEKKSIDTLRKAREDVIA